MGVIEDGLDDAAEILAAQLIEAKCAGVAVDGLAIPEVVRGADVIRAYPVDEIAFERGAIGMMADLAFAGVAFGIGIGFGRGDTFEGLIGRGHLRGLWFGGGCGVCGLGLGLGLRFRGGSEGVALRVELRLLLIAVHLKLLGFVRSRLLQDCCCG